TQGDVAMLRKTSEASLAAARRLAATSLEPWPRARLAAADLLAGEWDAALRGATEAVEQTRRTTNTRGLGSLLGLHSWVLVHLGRLAEARQYLDEAHALLAEMIAADKHIAASMALAGGCLALVEGDAAQARACAERLENWASGWLPLVSAALLGEARVRDGALDEARALGVRLRGVRSCSTPLPFAVADWIDGLAHAEEGQWTLASERLASSAESFDQLAMPYLAARARLAGGTAILGHDDTRAADETRRALEVFDRLGAPGDAQQARQVLRSLGVVPSRGRARARTGAAMSTRELEVARLVATGLSNADVATRLFVSPRTVTTHLDRIYTRLGLSSRVALTRYLADSGLLEGER
ncbi:MAG: LuxR C-terminal-related transcriptional regulator, partial [Trebonia sp.]